MIYVLGAKLMIKRNVFDLILHRIESKLVICVGTNFCSIKFAKSAMNSIMQKEIRNGIRKASNDIYAVQQFGRQIF